MPSQLHEVLLLLFRNRPSLAPELLRDALGVTLPEYSEARIDSADLTQVQPAEYRADLVVLLLHGEPVLGIVVEVQLSADGRKGYVWPVYVANLRARLECPVCLLVVTADEVTARWAGRMIDLGGSNRFTPFVIGPSGVPWVTSEEQARDDPELAVLSAMAHGQDPDIERSVQVAIAAQLASLGLDEDRSKFYCDLVQHALSEAARRALRNMDLSKYEYQSEFARRYVAQGREEGREQGLEKGLEQGLAKGRAGLLARLLAHRFGPLPDVAQERLAAASIEELDAIGERLLVAQCLSEALGES
jgi:Domain of unknown function (DUF4351)